MRGETEAAPLRSPTPVRWAAALLALALGVQLGSFLGVGPTSFVAFIGGVGVLGGAGLFFAVRWLVRRGR